MHASKSHLMLSCEEAAVCNVRIDSGVHDSSLSIRGNIGCAIVGPGQK